VTLGSTIAYSVGGLSDSIKTFSFTTFLLFYYTTVLGLPGTLLGLAMAVGLLWDAAVDPLIGHISDRASLRLGRRHGFMLIGAVVAGVSFTAVFNPPSGLGTGWLFAWLMISSLCLRSSSSLFMVPYYALGSELALDYHERTSISAYRAAAVLLGTMLATVAAFHVFLPTGTGGLDDAKYKPASYASMGAAFGAAITAVGLIATLGTLRERSRLPLASAEPSNPRALRAVLTGALRDRSFAVLFTATCLATMASALSAALSLYFLTYHARIAANEHFTWFFGAFYGGSLLGVSIWLPVSRHMQKHHLYAGATVVTAVIISMGYWLVGEGRPFGTGNLTFLMVANGLAGMFGVATSVMAPSMLADISAQDEARTGERRDGIFFGMYSFGQQLSGGLAVLIGGLLVDRFAGLVPGQAEQSAMTVERLAMISNLLPAAILSVAGLIALRYSLTRRDIEETQHKLGQTRARSEVLAPPEISA
jgi:glycoside/pentoside/hexuronide:cation symporter, GPH family